MNDAQQQLNHPGMNEVSNQAAKPIQPESQPVNYNATSQQGAYTAVRWSAAAKYGAMLVQLAVSLLLARLLAPEFFGLIGMAAVMTGFAKTLKSLGFNAAIIQRKDLDEVLISTLFWVNLGFCTFVTLILIAASPLATWMYQDDRVAPLVALLSINIFINSFTMVPSSLLQRRLEFRKLAMREIAGVSASAVVGIGSALAGYGVWSLAFATIAASLANVILLNITEPFRPRWTIDRLRLKECLKFGFNITGFNVFTYFSKNADHLIIGVLLGPLALGYYSLAYRFMRLPRDSMSRVISRVLFPKLSEHQDADKKLTQAFLRTIGGIALVTFPAMAGLALVAESMIEFFLIPKWEPAAPVVSLLAIVGAIQSLTILSGPLYLAKGRADWMLRWGMVVSVSYCLAFWVGAYWGNVGVATCYLIVNLLLFVPEMAIPFALVEGLTLRRLVSVLAPYLVATAVMTVSVMIATVLIHHWIGSEAGWFSVIVPVLTGMISYSIALLIQHPPAVEDYLNLIFGSRNRTRFPLSWVGRRAVVAKEAR